MTTGLCWPVLLAPLLSLPLLQQQISPEIKSALVALVRVRTCVMRTHSCRLPKPSPAGVAARGGPQRGGARHQLICEAPTDLKFVTGSDDSTVKVGSQHFPGMLIPPAASALCSDEPVSLPTPPPHEVHGGVSSAACP